MKKRKMKTFSPETGADVRLQEIEEEEIVDEGSSAASLTLSG